MLALIVTALLGLLPLAGIVAKGLGVIAAIFGIGVLIGVVLTISITSRIRRIGKH